MEKILAPKLLENPVMNPQAKKLARKQLVQRAVNIGRAQKAQKVAKAKRAMDQKRVNGLIEPAK
jgi:hypothetical protein